MAQPDKVKNGRRNARKLLQNDKFEEALVELDKRDEAFKKAKDNPKQWFKDQGVDLPGNPDTVEVDEGSLYVKFCWSGWCITFDWP